MKENKRRFKKRILMMIPSFVLVFSLFTTSVHAQTILFDYNKSFQFQLPWTYCSTEDTTTGQYEESFLWDLYTTGNSQVNLSASKYYFFIAQGGISVNDYVYSGSTANVTCEPYGYFLYNGEKYYMAQDGYCTFVSIGDGYYTLPYTLGATVTVSPYHTDGYYYACGYKANLVQNMRLRVYELTFQEVASEKQLYDLNVKLSALNAYMSNSVALQQTYYPKLNEMLLRLTHIDLDIDTLIEQLTYLTSEIDEQGITLDNIEHWTKKDYETLLEVAKKIDNLTEILSDSSSSDKNTTDNLKQDSDAQSNELNSLNEQNKVDKIDVDSASGTVDQNIDIDVDSNYAGILATFVSHKNYLKMLLAVSSMALISYVLFGKR